MFGKIGFIRTVEALIAILLLLSLILYIFSGNPKILPGTPEVVDKANSFIINEFLFNNTFRTCFTNTINEGKCDLTLNSIIGTSDNKNCNEIINDFISKSIPIGYAYDCEVCQSSKSCVNVNAPKDLSLYTKSAFIFSSTNARVVRIYLYEKK